MKIGVSITNASTKKKQILSPTHLKRLFEHNNHMLFEVNFCQHHYVQKTTLLPSSIEKRSEKKTIILKIYFFGRMFHPVQRTSLFLRQCNSLDILVLSRVFGVLSILDRFHGL